MAKKQQASTVPPQTPAATLAADIAQTATTTAQAMPLVQHVVPATSQIPGVTVDQLAAMPSFFADQAFSYGFGAYVSKITFGRELAPNGLGQTPVFSLTMPTAAIYLMAKQIIDTLDNPANRENILAALANFGAQPPSQKTT